MRNIFGVKPVKSEKLHFYKTVGTYIRFVIPFARPHKINIFFIFNDTPLLKSIMHTILFRASRFTPRVLIR